MKFSEFRNNGICTLFTCPRTQLRIHKWWLRRWFQNWLLDLFLRAQLGTRISQEHQFQTRWHFIKVHGELGRREVLEVLSWLLARYHVDEAFKTPYESKEQLLFLHDIIGRVVNIYETCQITLSFTLLEIVVIKTNACSVENKELMHVRLGNNFLILWIYCTNLLSCFHIFIVFCN